MTSERWQKIKFTLEEALELAPEMRPTFLEKSCGADENLRREIENLLEFENPEADLLEQEAVSSVLENEFNGNGKNFIGRKIGNYKIIGELGAGGMGVVFLAERADGVFNQKTALKIVKRGMDSDAILRRFYTERQILADLNHPNIARLLDGGTTDDDLPYFVMEHIEGEPLDKYCDRKELSISERLEIFRNVCAAVSYAHKNSVIHRDLKPSNILVTDGGTPKLLDFGIAKILRSDSSAQTSEITETMFRVMTPRYASPEQIRGERLSPSTDVYSLGILLYELLTGRSPYKIKNFQSAEIARFVSEETPARPSVAVTLAGEFAPTDDGNGEPKTRDYICRTRRVEPEKLRRRLRGDLDNIVLTALSKEPENRYDSVEEFSADIERHLEGLPVHARKFKAAHRGAAFVRRNVFYNWRASLTLVFLFLLVAGATSAFSVYLIRKWENPTATTSNFKSIAVLPFKYIGESATDENPLLGVGLADFLIAKLGQTRKLEVRPMSAVKTYGGGDVNPLPIGQTLGVETILSGVIRRENDTVSINAELTDVRDGKIIWKKLYNGKMSELVTLQNSISEELAQIFALNLTDSERDLLMKSRTNNIKAYELYVRGRYFWNLRNKDDYQKAIDYFNQAVKLDPNYADAYAGLADAYALLACVVPFDKRPERMQMAKDFARRALSLDETLANPHATLGFIGWHYDWDWETSDQEFQKAVALNPSYATAHQWYALLLFRIGRFDEAQAEIKKALDLDPLSFAMQDDQTEILFISRKYDEAIIAGQKTFELSPAKAYIYSFVIESYYHKGDYRQYIKILEDQVESSNHETSALKSLAAGYRRLNRADDFMKIFKELSGRGEYSEFNRYKTFEEIKKAFESTEKKSAFEWLDYEYKNRGAGITAIHVRPEWDSLRNDPQIQKYINEMKLSQYAVKGDVTNAD